MQDGADSRAEGPDRGKERARGSGDRGREWEGGDRTPPPRARVTQKEASAATISRRRFIAREWSWETRGSLTPSAWLSDLNFTSPK